MSLSQNVNPPKTNTLESQLFVNCTFDMDYLEITKNESLRKYEENVYLLGNIFAIEKDEKESENVMTDAITEAEAEADVEMKEEINNSSCRINEDEIIALFEKTHESSLEDEKSKIISLIQRIKNENTKYTDDTQNILHKQISNSLKDYQEHEDLLNNNKNNFIDSTTKFSDMNQKLRGIKTEEPASFFNEILKQADEMGILSETYKQYDNHLREKNKYNCELPFDPSNNIIIMPL